MILRKTRNSNDADDANDAESGIWYRDILKTASLSSRKNSEGVWGTPQKMRLWISKRYACKTRLPQNDGTQPRYPSKFVHSPKRIDCWFTKNIWLVRVNRWLIHYNLLIRKSESAVIHPKILTRKSASILIHFAKESSKLPVRRKVKAAEKCAGDDGLLICAVKIRQCQPFIQSEPDICILPQGTIT